MAMQIEQVDDTLEFALHRLAERIGVDKSEPRWRAITVELAVGFMLGSADRYDHGDEPTT